MALESGHVVKPTVGWYQRSNPETGEIAPDVKKRLKDLDSKFWIPLLEDESFNTWVQKRYSLGAGDMQKEFSDSDIEQEYDKV